VALSGVRHVSEGPEGSQLELARWRKLVFGYERVVMAQSTQSAKESLLHSRSHLGRNTDATTRDTWHCVHFLLLLSHNVCRVSSFLRDLTSVL